MTWLVILAVGAGSFLFRVAPLLLLGRVPLGPRAEGAVRHAGLAAVDQQPQHRGTARRGDDADEHGGATYAGALLAVELSTRWFAH